MALSCADMMQEAAEEYSGVELDTRSGKSVTLRNILMLPEEGLRSAQEILGEFADGDEKDAANLEKLVPRLKALLLLVADNPKALEAEMKDWPMGMYVRVVDAWQEKTQVGEAQGSDS